MLKSRRLILMLLLAAGCTSRPADPIAAEKAELDAQIAAMKHHPSVLERAKSHIRAERAAPKRGGRS